MAGINIGVNGAWKEMDNLSIGVGGAWKQVERVSIGVSGAWKTAWIYLSVVVTSIDAFRLTISPTDASATISILNDGSLSATNSDGSLSTGTWLAGGTPAQVDVYLSGTGDALASGTLNTWLNCGTTRSWTLTNTNNGGSTKLFSGTMQWRNATTLEVLDTAPITIEASVEV